MMYVVSAYCGTAACLPHCDMWIREAVRLHQSGDLLGEVLADVDGHRPDVLVAVDVEEGRDRREAAPVPQRTGVMTSLALWACGSRPWQSSGGGRWAR